MKRMRSCFRMMTEKKKQANDDYLLWRNIKSMAEEGISSHSLSYLLLPSLMVHCWADETKEKRKKN